MPYRFACPVLDGEVELTDEREEHIRLRHPDLLPQHFEELAATIQRPDEVLPAFAGASQLLVRWTDKIRGGRYVVAVVVTDPADTPRHWVVTAYLTRIAPEAA